MKKLFLLLMLLTFFMSIDAQTCKINGTKDSIEVYTTSISQDKSSVDVIVGNDSSTEYANISVTIKVLYSINKKVITYTGKGFAEPQKKTTITIPIDASLEPYSVEFVEIKGSKCE